MLRDMGADVIKIEAPDRLDQGRGPAFGPLFHNEGKDEPWNRSGSFQSLNRGKRAIALDLRSAEGRDVLLRLVASADVLLENFTPRVMRGWGLTYDALAAVNSRLVMLSNTGYGGTGPWSAFKAQGTTLDATMGVGNYCGYVGDKPTKVGQSYPDFVACWTGLTALFAALVHRSESGLGQRIDIGMYQLGSSMVPEAFVAVQSGAPDFGRTGNADLDVLLSAVVPAAGEDRWLAVSVPERPRGAASARSCRMSDPSPGGIRGRTARLGRDAFRRSTRRRCCRMPASPPGRSTTRATCCSTRTCSRAVCTRTTTTRWRTGPDRRRAGARARFSLARGLGPRRHPGPRPALRLAQRRGARRAGYRRGDARDMRARGVLTDRPVSPPDLAPANLATSVASGYYREIDPDFRERIRRFRDTGPTAEGDTDQMIRRPVPTSPTH